jgi:putative oxidoreductase
MNDVTAFLDRYRERAALVLRVAFGAHLMFVSTELFQPAEQRAFAGYLATLHIPFPLMSAYMAHITEFFGGLALILGLMVRPAAGALVFNFIVAVGIAMRGQPYAKQAPALQMLAVAIFFLIHGAGDWSVDAWARRSEPRDE